MYIYVLSATATVPCCPNVYVALNSPSSVIEPLSGYRVHIEIVAEYGNCTEATANDSTFELVTNLAS